MADILKLLLFVGTVALAAGVAAAKNVERKRRAVVLFVAVCGSLSIVAGMFRVDAWPFARYAMIMYVAPRSATSEIVVRAIDGNGVERAIDPFSVSPLFPTALASWFERRMPLLSAADRSRALHYILARAETSRRRLREGGRIGAARWLGPLAAPPDWGLYRHPEVSSSPLAAIRVYRVRWTDPARKQWTLLADSSTR